MASGGLDASLSSVWEEAASNSEKDLCTNDTTVSAHTAAVVNHKAQCHQEETGTEQDEGL